MEHTKYSYMTEDELILRVENNPSATEMERELASRLAEALDDLDSADEELEAVEEILQEHGIQLELVEHVVQ